MTRTSGAAEMAGQVALTHEPVPVSDIQARERALLTHTYYPVSWKVCDGHTQTTVYRCARCQKVFLLDASDLCYMSSHDIKLGPKVVIVFPEPAELVL